MRHLNISWVTWIGMTLVLILSISTMVSSSVYDFQGHKPKNPTKWEFQCAKYLKIQYHSEDKVQFSEDFADEVTLKKETKLHEKSLNINFQDSTLILRQVMEETSSFVKCQYYSLRSCPTEFLTENKFYFKFSDGTETTQRNLTMQIKSLPNEDFFGYTLAVDINDELSGTSFEIYKMIPNPRPDPDPRSINALPASFNNVNKGSMSIELPVLNTMSNFSTLLEYPEAINGTYVMSLHLKMHWNNESATLQLLDTSYKYEDLNMDFLHENEKVAKTRENAIQAIFAGQEVPKSVKDAEFKFALNTDQKGSGSLVGNLTSADLGSSDYERWIFIESEGWRWPVMDFSWSHLEMRKKPQYDGWLAAIGKFFFGQLTLKSELQYYSSWMNPEIVFRFNSHYPISQAVLKFDVGNSSLDLTLDSLEKEWNLHVVKAEGPAGLLSASLTRTDFWTQHKKPVTLLNVTVTSETNLEATFKISEFENYKDIFKTMIKIIGPMQTLLNDNILSTILDLFADVVGGSTNEDFRKEVNLLETLVKNVGRILYKNWMDFTVEKKLNIKDVFITSLNKTGGSYVEEEDTIILKYPLTNLMGLPMSLYEELVVQCED